MLTVPDVIDGEKSCLATKEGFVPNAFPVAVLVLPPPSPPWPDARASAFCLPRQARVGKGVPAAQSDAVVGGPFGRHVAVVIVQVSLVEAAHVVNCSKW